MVLLEQHETERLKRLAEVAYPEEFCAILLGRRRGERVRVAQVLPVTNVHDRPRRAYAIATTELIAAQRQARERKLEIVGFAHSHPDHPAEPSATDRELAYWPACVWGIVGVDGGVARQVRWFWIRGGEVEETTSG
jgi:proteasome lid subunit RPN8/RPN11